MVTKTQLGSIMLTLTGILPGIKIAYNISCITLIILLSLILSQKIDRNKPIMYFLFTIMGIVAIFSTAFLIFNIILVKDSSEGNKNITGKFDIIE